ncbi:MAG: polysaccharide deacetylase [Spirochaetota bacterium]
MDIKDYSTYYGTGILNKIGAEIFIIRKYSTNNNIYFLTVNPRSLQTSVIEDTDIKFNIIKSSLQDIRTKYRDTNYIKSLIHAEKNALPLQNAGITNIRVPGAGVFLTADLCPSGLPLDKLLFTETIEKFTNTSKPLPVGLCVTGLWLEKHAEDVKWINALYQKGALSVTWINHSYYHRFAKDLPLKNNFLLMPGVKLDNEVLNTEKKMLELGLVPSVFFRFPGLVSDRELFFKITGYGLIPLGSDAWLAKNQEPKEGSIVLVHANGNEPAGIYRFFKLLKDERENITKKRWYLLDLRESLSQMINDSFD